MKSLFTKSGLVAPKTRRDASDQRRRRFFFFFRGLGAFGREKEQENRGFRVVDKNQKPNQILGEESGLWKFPPRPVGTVEDDAQRFPLSPAKSG